MNFRRAFPPRLRCWRLFFVFFSFLSHSSSSDDEWDARRSGFVPMTPFVSLPGKPSHLSVEYASHFLRHAQVTQVRTGDTRLSAWYGPFALSCSMPRTQLPRLPLMHIAISSRRWRKGRERRRRGGGLEYTRQLVLVLCSQLCCHLTRLHPQQQGRTQIAWGE